MKIEYTNRALRTLKRLPLPVRNVFYKQAEYLVENLQHPSLHAKKFDEANDVWQARVNKKWRFYFRIEEDRYIITNVTPHPG